LLQPKLNLRVSQRQVLTPGLVQMVSVLALNKLELREMINTEMVENPVLEEVEESTATLAEMAGREGDRERSAEEVATANERVEKDPFDEIDFGSYFQDYLDPGFRTTSNFEEYDRPSFDNFLSQPRTLSGHLEWQLGSMTLTPRLRMAADLIVGNLNEDGYLTASDAELADALAESLLRARGPARADPIPFERGIKHKVGWDAHHTNSAIALDLTASAQSDGHAANGHNENGAGTGAGTDREWAENLATVLAAREIVHQLDPVGIGARDLRECLLIQIGAQRREAQTVLAKSKLHAAHPGSGLYLEQELEAGPESEPLPAPALVNSGAAGAGGESVHRASNAADVFEIAAYIVSNNLALLQKKDMRELTRSCGRSAEEVQGAVDYIRTLDPRPGQRYNQSETRLIEPDVAFVKRDGQYVVVMDEEDMPTLRLSHGYRKMLREKKTEKEVREYVKERYKSAIQLLRNIEQRKNTILRTCEVIVRRQSDFLERGEDGLRPMMIKEVAEEIGVHPSTVSRAVSNKYVHTPQGVYELRFFFSEGVNGPEGGDLPLVLLKRKVKKLIEEEDARRPLTDDQLAAELQRQGIQVTRRTVAKYREDMQIPSTHQRRVR
jgi:RNA polymerase sigma-54 factor